MNFVGEDHACDYRVGTEDLKHTWDQGSLC